MSTTPSCIYPRLAPQPMQGHINVGFGSDITIYQLAHAVGQAVGYTGHITFDATQPDGSPRKWMDSSRLNALGWQPQVALAQGLTLAYQDFLQAHGSPPPTASR